MQVPYNQLADALRAVDGALDTVVREEDRLIGILNSKQASPDERFQALADCLAMTQQLQITLAEAESECEPARKLR